MRTDGDSARLLSLAAGVSDHLPGLPNSLKVRLDTQFVGMGAGFRGLRVRLAPAQRRTCQETHSFRLFFGMRGGASYLPRQVFVPAEELLVSPRDLALLAVRWRIPGEVPLGSSFLIIVVAVVDRSCRKY